MAKKALFLTIVLCLVVALMTVTAFAADTVEPATGACGEGLTWTVDAQGKLTISGTGAMETYDYGSAPWYGYRDAITSVVVEGTVTGISDGAFHGFSAVVDMTLPFVGGSVRATEQIYQYPLGHIFGTASYDGGVETLQRFYWYHLEELVSNTYYIPGSLRSVTVTGGNILAGAFYNCSGLTNVDLSDGIDCIRECAFTHCESLTSVDIPEGVTRIWECAFSSCSALESVSIPDSVTWIGGSAFRGCTKLTEVVIPQNVTILEGYAFSGCSALEKVIFCGNVPQTISIPFEGITVEAYYPSDNATWTADALLDYGGTVTWVAYDPAPEIVASGSCGAEGADVEWTLDSNGLMKIFGTGDMMDYPRETVDGASCSTTPWREFCGSIVSVVIEPGVTSIGDDAFDGCNHMVDIQISEGITRIGEDAFCECSALEEVVLPGSVTNIAEGAFSACFEMRSITLPDSVVSIGKNAFRYCFALRNINIPTGLTRIEEYTFYECTALVDVVVPEGVESIGERAFELCEKLESVRLPESLTSIEWGAFCGCFKLTEINIPECLTHIGGCAFYSARLAQVTIPGSVTSIGKRAFGECKLTEIVIPESVASIEDYAFEGCTGLTRIRFCGDAPQMGADVFSGVTATASYPFGNTTWTADVMQDYGGTLTWLALTEPVLQLDHPSLSFEDEVRYNVYYTVDDLSCVVEMGLITFADKAVDGTVADAVAVVPGYVTDGSMYMVRTEGVAAPRMGDVVYFKVFAKLADGSYAYSPMGGYSAVAYAKQMLADENTSARMKSLVVAMLDYGAEAQKFFGYDTEDLMDAFLTEAQAALVECYDEGMMDPPVSVDAGKTGVFVQDSFAFGQCYPTVSFNSAFALNYYFTAKLPCDGGMTLYYWDAQTYEAVDKLAADNATGSIVMENLGDGQYWGQVAGIAAKELDHTVFAVGVYTFDGVTYTTGIISYSLGRYCEGIAANDASSQQALAKATAVYGYYAKAYFAG